jgi:adenylate cyclase
MSGNELKQRLAAIMAADASGYSRLMSLDERATVAALDAARLVFRSHVEANQGRVIDMAGDSVLAVFETATGAVAAALAVQAEFVARVADVPEAQRMRFRIGIHLGDVIEKIDGSVYGDGVNIAARLEGLAEPGGITVSESIQVAVRSRIAASFEDLGAQQVKNIAEPIHVYRIAMPRQAVNEGPATVVGTGKRVESGRPRNAIYDKPSVAVLPFTNMGGDPEQEYFSDGLTEDIITALAAWRSFPVISRNSTFAYKGQSPDVRKVAHELGARYVLEGSVRKAGHRVRITGQLIDGLSGNHLWAEKYDRDFSDLFEVQDEITTRIVAAIEPEMSSAEIRQIIKRPAGSLNAWDLYMQGLANMPTYGKQRGPTKLLFERAVLEDPNFVDAITALAMCHSADVYASRSDDVQASIACMFDLAQRASLIDARHFRIHLVLCVAHFWQGDMSKAVAAGRQSVALNPSSAEAYEGLSAALCHLGLAQEAEESAGICMQLTPVGPRAYYCHFMLMQALLGQRRFEESYEHLMRAMASKPHDIVMLGHKTVLLGHLGRGDEARAALDLYLGKRGLKSADEYRKLYVRSSALTELNLEGLRKAGWNV